VRGGRNLWSRLWPGSGCGWVVGWARWVVLHYCIAGVYHLHFTWITNRQNFAVCNECFATNALTWSFGLCRFCIQWRMAVLTLFNLFWVGGCDGKVYTPVTNMIFQHHEPLTAAYAPTQTPVSNDR
jgi:hypothetical protein